MSSIRIICDKISTRRPSDFNFWSKTARASNFPVIQTEKPIMVLYRNSTHVIEEITEILSANVLYLSHTAPAWGQGTATSEELSAVATDAGVELPSASSCAWGVSVCGCMKGEDLLHRNMGEQQLQLAARREPCEKHQNTAIPVKKATLEMIINNHRHSNKSQFWLN